VAFRSDAVRPERLLSLILRAWTAAPQICAAHKKSQAVFASQHERARKNGGRGGAPPRRSGFRAFTFSAFSLSLHRLGKKYSLKST
jgi:hypothetical protein